jgi:hypothetical protein
MSWRSIEYSYPVAYVFQKELLWLSKDINVYFAFKLEEADNWTYFAADASHALITGKILAEQVSEAAAQTNYLRTSRDSAGKVLAVLPRNIQAKYARMYIATGDGVWLREWRPSIYLSAHEIIAGTLEITDELAAAPKIQINVGANTYGVLGNLNGFYGIANDYYGLGLGKSDLTGNYLLYDHNSGTLKISGSITATVGTIGGWTITSGYIYSLASGTPTVIPNDGIVLSSVGRIIRVYENTEKRVELGNLESDVYGLRVYDDNGSTILFEISDSLKSISGWTIGATTLANSTNIVLDASSKAISINNSTYGTDGIQLQYNAGNPRFYVGDGANEYFQFDGADISWKGTNTELTAAGAFTATSATITGAITASSGSVGSFTIGTYLYTGTKTAYNDTNAGVHLGNDGIGIGNNVFTVSAAGALVATSATITGAINANTGTIGGLTNYWNITAGTITSVLAGSLVMGSVGSTIKLGAATDIDTGIGLFADGAGNIRVGSATSGTEYIKFASSVLTIKSSTFNLQASNAGSIGLTATTYALGDGVWLSSTVNTRFRVGNAAKSRMEWNDVDLQIYNSSNVLMASFGATNSIAGFYVGQYDLWGGNAAIGNVATTIVLGNLDGTSKITLGATADAITDTLNPGIYMDGTGKFRAGTATAGTNFFWFDGTNISWKGTNTSLTAAGAFTASSATITGVITANTGYIGGASGWVISAGYIKDVAGVVGLSTIVTAGDDVRFWAGHATPGSAPFYVTEAGVIKATSGTIGGWILDTTLLQSANAGAARIVLDQSLMRISIKDSTNASKVVMGYLNGLSKHDGTGNWGAADYGFWAVQGDKLVIDGDTNYKSGDWIVENDGSFLIQNAAVKTIVRLGIDTAEKGLFIYDATGATQMAKFISDSAIIGYTANEHVAISTTSIQMKNGAIVLVDLTNAVLTLGDSANEHTLINTSGVALKDGASVYALFAATTTIGLTTSEHISISTTAVQIKDGATVYTDLTAGVLTLGDTANEYVKVSTSGFQIYDGAALYATYGATTTIGLVAGEHISISSTAVQMKNGAIVLADLTNSILTLGDSANEHVLVDTSGMSVKDGATIHAVFAATTTIGATAGGEYVKISSTGIEMYGNNAQRVNIASDGTGWLGTSSGITWDAAGAITAATGIIGGFHIAADNIHDAADTFGLASTVAGAGDVRFWAGDEYAHRAVAPFRVTKEGALVATSATITGIITGSYVYGSSLMTKGTYLTVNCAADDDHIHVGELADFPASGSASFIDSGEGDRDAFTYTGKSAASGPGTLTGIATSGTATTRVLAHDIATHPLVVPAVGGMYISDAVNEMRFFGDRGDGTVEELASIGIVPLSGSDYFIAKFGGTTSTRYASLAGYSNSGIGVLGSSGSNYGVKGYSNSGYGVYGQSGISHAVYADGTAHVVTNLTIGGTLGVGNNSDFTGHIRPSADSTYTCGASNKFWSYGYFDNIITTGNITIADNGWLGLASDHGRIEFHHDAPNAIALMDCNVGIGTVSPTPIGVGLHIEGANDASVKVKSTISGGNVYFNGVSGSAADMYVTNTTARDLYLGVGGQAATNVVIKNGGNVGIGTVAPANKVSVWGNNADEKATASSATSANAGGVSLAVLRDGATNVYGGYSSTEAQWSLGYVFSVATPIYKVRWYNLATSERNKHFYIEYSLDGSTSWTKIPITGWAENSTVSSVDEAEAGNTDGWNTVTFNCVSAKGFRITVTTFWAVGDINAGISEIEMYSPGSLFEITNTGQVLIGATAAIGTEKLRVDGDVYVDHNAYFIGNVGIGTATPASLTEIQGGTGTTGAVLTLGTKETSTVLNDVLGRINFYAPLDASGTDAILPGASIAAIATASFSSSVNSTALHFQTGNSETAVGQTRLYIGPTGNVGFNTTDIEAWHANYKAIEFGAASSLCWYGTTDGEIHLSQNAYINAAGSWARKTAAIASTYRLSAGGHCFRVSDTGTTIDTNPNWITALTIGPTGGVTVGDSGTDPGLHNLLVDGIVRINTTALGGKLNLKEVAADAYGIVIEASGNDAWIRMGHNATQGQIHTTYNASAGATPLWLGTHLHLDTLILGTDGNSEFTHNLLVDGTLQIGAAPVTYPLTVYKNTGAATPMVQLYNPYGATTVNILELAHDHTIGSIGADGYFIRMIADKDGTPADAAYISGGGNAFFKGTLHVDGVATLDGTIDISGAASGQIKFPAAQNASADVNTLDDYEEGTWDVTVTCGTSGTITVSATSNSMQYTKIGRMVTISGYILIESVSSPVGQLRVSLPFTCATQTENGGYTALPIACAGLETTGTTSMIAYTVEGAAYFIIEHFTAGVAANAAADVKANSSILIGGSYFV